MQKKIEKRFLYKERPHSKIDFYQMKETNISQPKGEIEQLRVRLSSCNNFRHKESELSPIIMPQIFYTFRFGLRLFVSISSINQFIKTLIPFSGQ